MPRFLVHHPREGSRVFELLGERPVSIGRAKSAGLVLDNDSVSRSHAVVRATPDGRWEIIDRGSANGVKVNGKPVKEALLRGSDEVTIGEYILRFCEDSGARDMITYGTPQFSARFAQVLSESAYSGTFQAVHAISDVGAGAASGRLARPPERVRSIEHENRLVGLLNRVNRTLADLETVEEVTGRIVDLVLEIEGAERAFTMLLDAESIGRGDFSRGGYGFEPASIRLRPNPKASRDRGAPSLTISQSIIRQVMQAGLPLLITDAQSDPRLAASQSVAAAGIQSAMCAPLSAKDRRFGLLYVDNLSRRGMFTVEELNVFAVIASQAGVAMDRVRARTVPAAPSGPTSEKQRPETPVKP